MSGNVVLHPLELARRRAVLAKVILSDMDEDDLLALATTVHRMGYDVPSSCLIRCRQCVERQALAVGEAEEGASETNERPATLTA